MNGTQFTIEDKLNESGTTVVYKAFDGSLHRHVLLKVLHKHLANDPDIRARFVREARACAALRSEHIAQVYDLTEIDGAPAIVMEFVHGSSLKEAITAGDRATLDFARKTAVHVLRGLAAAHDRGIIHRDIKPGNILVSEDGVLKVTDFGLASMAVSPTVTMEGMVLGTPAYMAPEQVRGDDVDARTDLFALGVTLIEVLSRERIFEGTTYAECMKKVLGFKAADLDRFAPLSSPEFQAFLLRLVHPDKAQRFTSAREALDVIDGKRSTAVLRPITDPAKRSILLPALVALVVLAAAFLFVWSRQGNEPPSQSVETVDLPQQLPVTHDTTARSVPTQNTEPEKKKIPTDETRPNTVEKPAAVVVPSVTTAKDSAKVLFTSTPWAKVYVNDQLIGETPMAKPVWLTAGNATVVFTNPSFEPITRTIVVEGGKEQTVNGNFLERTAYLHCTVKPWAEVYVDDQYKDTTPLSKPMMVSAGRHTIRFRNASFSDVSRDVTIAPKETLRIVIEMTK